MNELFEELRNDPDMQEFEYRHAWADAHLNSMIAMQIKIIREQRGWNQSQLALESEMAQPRISLLEDVNYSAWSINTLKRIARSYDLRLRVSFEEFGSLENELGESGKNSFERRSFTEDPSFSKSAPRIIKSSDLLWTQGTSLAIPSFVQSVAIDLSSYTSGGTSEFMLKPCIDPIAEFNSMVKTSLPSWASVLTTSPISTQIREEEEPETKVA